MAEAGTISFKLVAATQAFQKGMQQAQSSLGKFKNSLGSLQGAIAAVGIGALGRKFTSLARTQIEAEQRLAGAIRATGAAIDATKLKQYAADLQKVTTFGDEATISAAAMLVPFGMTEDQIKAMLPRLQDFSAAMGVDLTTAAKLFGRAIESGQADLSRYGVSLNDTQKELLKNGDATERAALLTDLLNKKFGGMAQELAKTDFGKYDQAMNSLGDTMEELGMIIMPALAKSMQVVNVGIQGIVAGARLVGTLVGGGIDSLGPDAFEQIFGDFERAKRALEGQPPAEIPAPKIDSEGLSKQVSRALRKGLEGAKPAEDKMALRLAAKIGRELRQKDFVKGTEGGIIGPSLVVGMRAGGGGQREAFETRTASQDVKSLGKHAKEASIAIGEQLISKLGKAGPALLAFTQGKFKEGLIALGVSVITNSKAFQTLVRGLDGFMDALSSVIDILLPLVEVIADAIGWISDGISKITGKIQGGVRKLGKWMGIGGDEAEKFAGSMFEANQILGKFVEQWTTKGADLGAIERLQTGNIAGLSEETLSYIQKVGNDKLAELGDLLAQAELFGDFEKAAKIRAQMEPIQASLDTIGKTLEDGAAGLEDAMEEVAASVTNIPEGVKVALNRFQAIEADTPMIDAATNYQTESQQQTQASGGNVVYADTIVVQGADADEFFENVEAEIEARSNAVEGALAYSGRTQWQQAYAR